MVPIIVVFHFLWPDPFITSEFELSIFVHLFVVHVAAITVSQARFLP